MIDAQTHERLNNMEKILFSHTDKINMLEVGLVNQDWAIADQGRAINENTQITKNIEANTDELVKLFKGVKSLRQLVLFYAPLAAIFAAIWTGISWLSHNIEKFFS